MPLDPDRRFAYLPLQSPLHNPEALRAVAQPYRAALESLGGGGSAPGEDPSALLILTGGTERLALEAIEARREPRRPVLLIAHPGHNALPAALEILAWVQQHGRRGRVVYLPSAADPAGLDEIVGWVQRQRIQQRLRTARIGVIGQPSDWLVASRPTAAAAAAAWGPELIDIPIGELLAECRTGPPPELGPVGAGWFGDSCGTSLPVEDLTAAGNVWQALSRIVQRRALTAVTLRCFDVIGELGTTGCLALARLNDDGIPAGCEGDVPAVLTMLWSGLIAGHATWMANPARADAAANRLWLAHCTVPASLVHGYHLTSHFESGRGAAIAGHFPLGPVTLVRIGGTDLRRVWIAEGDIEDTGAAPDLCRTQILVRFRSPQIARLLTAPLGNHLVAVPGLHRSALLAYLDQCGPDGLVAG